MVSSRIAARSAKLTPGMWLMVQLTAGAVVDSVAIDAAVAGDGIPPHTADIERGARLRRRRPPTLMNTRPVT